jgi:hypothetical protein
MGEAKRRRRAHHLSLDGRGRLRISGRGWQCDSRHHAARGAWNDDFRATDRSDSNAKRLRPVISAGDPTIPYAIGTCALGLRWTDSRDVWMRHEGAARPSAALCAPNLNYFGPLCLFVAVISFSMQLPSLRLTTKSNERERRATPKVYHT